MTDKERLLLEKLDQIVHSEEVISRILRVIQRVREDLARKLDALMAWEPVDLAAFGPELPSAIRSGWVFVLRAGVDTGAERHPSSHQRMMTFDGTGDMKIDATRVSNDVTAESEIVWESNVLVGDPGAALEQRWISILPNVWHRPVIPKGAIWVVVSFHTVPADELIEERPGAKQMLYESERKRSQASD